MNKTRLLRLSFLLLISLAAFFIYQHFKNDEPDYLHQKEVKEQDIYIFKGVAGPLRTSLLPVEKAASWKKYETDNLSALAIMLTDSSSNWLGLVHGLKNIGIPFIITDRTSEAVKHNTVLVYPVISGKVLSRQDLQLLAAVPRNGGNLIGVNVLGGGLNEVCGFDSVIASNKRNTLLPSANLKTVANVISEEPQIRLTNPDDFVDAFPTNGYTNADKPLFTYVEDSTAVITFKDYGKGKAFAIGLDIGTYFLRYMNARGFNAYKKYANQYDPGMDVLLRLIKDIYVGTSSVVTLGTVPFNKSLTLLITHDVDYTKSVANTVKYAELEQQLGVRATYFIQTKYIRDWNDEIFFNDKNLHFLKIIQNAGMEIASHSISHSAVFSQMPLGTGKEQYPKYRPFVQDRKHVFNGSILGELRVSKYLLETLLPGTVINSFRPGHLEQPFILPEALIASDYLYSSAVTANNVQTHFPYMSFYGRGFTSEVGIVQLPITIEDEMGLPMLERLDSALNIAENIGRYGGLMNVLIHTDITGQKLEFERKLLMALKEKAWISTVNDFGKWWFMRNNLIISVRQSNGFDVSVTNPNDEAMQGVCLQLPADWKISSSEDYYQEDRSLIIKTIEPRKTKVFHFL